MPAKSETEEIVDPDDGKVFQLCADHFHYILFGGDQLTAERATGVKRSIDNENRALDRFNTSYREDWYSKVCFLKVSDINIYVHVK